MRINVKTGISIGATVLVILIAVFMFGLAGQPMTGEGEAAQTWAKALCEGRIDDLYDLSALPADVERAAFVQQVTDYLKTSDIPQPCVGQVNFNVIRDLAVPPSLTKSIDKVRYFAEVVLNGIETDQNAAIPLWLYHTVGGQWRVWAEFLGTTLEMKAATGAVASILDVNGIVLGSIHINPPVLLYKTDSQILIGVPVELQTFSKPWEYYEAQLFIDQQHAQAIDHADQLPEELQQNYLAPVSSYSPQNLHQSGTLWFRAVTTAAPMLLAFTARVPYSGITQATYLDISVDSAKQIAPYNPFADVRFEALTNNSPVFTIQMNTAAMPMNYFRLDCSHFVLVLVTDEWKRGTDCGSFQGGWQDFLPNEQSRLTVTFAGYNISSADQIKALMYRRGDDTHLMSYTLWENTPPAGN